MTAVFLLPVWALAPIRGVICLFFVISRTDYCNILLFGLPQYALDRLQRVLNAAARTLCGTGKYSHVSDFIRDRLHWLPVSQRTRFKLCLMMYKAMHGLVPVYLTELCATALHPQLVIREQFQDGSENISVCT